MSAEALRLAALAGEHKSAGRLVEAAESWRAALKAEPRMAVGWINLGNLLKQEGKLEQAVQCYREALQLAPQAALGHANLGAALQDLGKHSEAIASYELALTQDANLAEVHCNLGDALQAQDMLNEALRRYRKAVSLQPGFLHAHQRLIDLLRKLKCPAEELAALDQALLIAPDLARLHAQRAHVLMLLNMFEEARQACEQALVLEPALHGVRLNLGTALFRLGRDADAIREFEASLRAKPDASGWANLGAVQRSLRRLQDAEASLREAVRLEPRNVGACNNLALVLLDRHAYAEAEASLRAALEYEPENADAMGNLASVLEAQGRLADALALRQRQWQLRPGNPEDLSRLLFGMSYQADISAADYLATAREYGKLVTQSAPLTAWRCTKAPAVLRVGLVSGDLWRHPVGYFLESVLASIDPARVELVAYRTSNRSDDLSERIAPRFAAWRSIVGLDDRAAAGQIEADGVHVLVDLSGYTAGNRLPLFAWKPAPVQASWLGYFASTGMPQIDYIISDPISAGENGAAQFVEALWLLPETRLCFSAPHGAPEVAPLPALHNGWVTFGCTQNISKLSDEVLRAWGRIFQGLPTARLRLQCRQLADPTNGARLAARLAAAGIDLDRVQMLGPVSRLDYLGTYAGVDIVLDTFPYPGGTTTCEALWMGVPTVTLTGSSMLTRPRARLLPAAGPAAWSAADVEQYISLAVNAAGDLERLAQLRRGLRATVAASPLCDAPRFARHLEQALWGMWERSAVRQPSQSRIQATAALFNQRQFAQCEQAALALCQEFPDHAFGWNVLGLVLRNLQRAPEAIACYRRAHELAPRDASILSNLAVCQIELNRHLEACASCEAALAIDPTLLGGHINRGNALRALGQGQASLASYRQALVLAPDHVDALANLANVACDEALYDEASVAAQRAATLAPQRAGPVVTLGLIHQRQGRLHEAAECFRRASVLQPELPDGYIGMAGLLRAQGDLEGAETCWQAALLARPGDADIVLGLAIVQRDRGVNSQAESTLRGLLQRLPRHTQALADLSHVLFLQGRMDEAEAVCRAAIAADPEHAASHNALGAVLRQRRQFDLAEACFARAIACNPQSLAAHNNMGALRTEQGRWDLAETSYRAALALDPACGAALVNLGSALMSQGRFAEAQECQRAALILDPNDAAARDNLLFALNFDPATSAEARWREALDYGAMARTQAKPFGSWKHAAPDGRLRVGVVSGDLRHHPVGHFLAGVVEALDRSRIELYAYQTDHRFDSMSARLQPHFSSWKSIQGMSDAQAATLIHDDAVHILLDLAGHTGKNRLPVFAWRPAPVQGAWLGYFATTGLEEIDFLLVDHVGVPPDQNRFFTEKVRYLPRTRLCFTPTSEAPSVSPLPALSKGYLTFGSFQVLTKVSDEVLACWGAIMQRMPQTRLRVQCRQLADPTIRSKLLSRFATYGVAAERIELVGPAEYLDYLAAHAEVDILLDTFPFPGGTTTCEALWMGVPTITLAGSSLLERQGASLLTAAGLGDWVAQDLAAYVELAVARGSDIAALATLRAALRTRVAASPVFDAPAFADDLAAALHAVWREFSGAVQ